MRTDPARLMGDAPFGLFHAQLIAICFVIAAVDGFDTQCISFVAPSLQAQWQIPQAAFGPLFSAGLFGTMLGAMALGLAADRFGRKPIALACVVLFGVMSLLSATAPSLEVLALYRFVGGIGLGGVIPNVIALVSEYSPQRHRATMVVAMFCGFPLGAMAGGTASHGIIEHYGWEAIFVLGGALPLVLAVIAAFALPESPRFLAQRARWTTLNAILARIGGPSAAARAVKVGTADHAAGGQGTRTHEHRKTLAASVLFTGGRGQWTILLWLLSFLGMLLTYFLINWTPLLLVSAGIPQENAIMAVVLLNAGGVVGGLIIGRLIDRISVFAMLAFAFALGSACVYALGATLGITLTLTLAMTCATGLTLFGGQMNFPGLTANYYPVHMRSTGAGWAMAFGRIGSVLGPLVGGGLIALGLDTPQLLMLASLPAACAVIVIIALARACPETATGRPVPISEGR